MQFRLWVKTSVTFLLIATFLGAFLRYLFVDPIQGINFKYFLHTHSHIAFLGWIFNALFTGLVYSFLPYDHKQSGRYNVLFLLLVASVLGMMFSFPFQGYGAVSIAFSTLHVFLSFIFVYFFVRDTRKLYPEKPISLQFAYWSMFFLVLSSLGPFSLGYIMANNIEGPLYKLSIYFYLHLQYDGWFTFAVFALFYRYLENHVTGYNRKAASIFLWIFALCCLPTYANSTLWAKPPQFMYIIALVVSFVQVAGLWYFLKSVKVQVADIRKGTDKWVFRMVIFAMACFVLKNILQLVGAFPALAELFYTVRNLLIAYLHLVFLGFITIFLLAWLRVKEFWTISSMSATLFISAFILSEILLVIHPLFISWFGYIIPGYYLMLFFVSLIMPLSLLGTVFYQNRKKNPL